MGMHGFLSNLTAALLALHTVLGCCWHHAHRCTQTCATAGPIASSDSCQGDHAHHAGTAPDSGGQGHHGRHDCRGSTCVFVNSSKANPHELALQLDVPPAAPAPGGSPTVCDVVGQWPYYPPDALLPPLRLHLVCRVLLI